MSAYELTVISRFHSEEEQISIIPVARATLHRGATELFYEYQGDLVKIRFDGQGFVMKRTGKVGYCLSVSKSGGFLRLSEGGTSGETPLVTDFYAMQDSYNVAFEYHYESMGDDKSQRENIKLFLKKSEEK
ncbi:MAG: hypothetical protein K2N84_03475 [Clostridia bacterium]|nr:hypothetical protein [Clostridia bacterium]